MRKTLIKIFIIILSVSICTINHANHNQEHVHAAAIKIYPECGGTLVVDSNTATCTSSGTITYKCNCGKCGYTETESSPALGHDFVKQASSTEPTCTEEGTYVYVCSRCSTASWEKVAALGHDYKSSITKEATCETEGTRYCKCSRCDDDYNEKIYALGHNYLYKTIKEATCTTDGLRKYTCTRCDDTYEKVIDKLGHNYVETENVPATCTTEGHITKICKNCNDKQTEIIKALGHDVEFKTTKEATCTETGLKSGVCKTCGDEVTETILAKGHSYPKQWTIDKEASIFFEGQESKTCDVCGNVETQVIPKKEVPVAVPVSVGGASVAAVVLFALKKSGKFAVKKAVEKTAKDSVKNVAEKATKELLEPSFEEKTIVTCMKQDDFYKSMKLQKYLVVVETEFDDISSAIEENEPSLAIIDVSDKKLNSAKKTMESIKEELKEKEIDALISLLVSKNQLSKQQKLLDQLKADELIKDYACVESNASVNLVKLVLPVMRPDLKSDEGLENIGMVADALNIPGVSTIIDLYINGREIKTTIDDGKEDGLSAVDKATIISDLASILGLDTVASVAGLVGDVDDIKSSLEAKVGGNEVSTTKDAVTDIVDVVGDIINK